MTSLPLRGEFVTLSQAVKLAGLAESGGQAKLLVRGGTVRVNGEVVTQPGKKLRRGDRFECGDGQEWILTE